jgi:hypothetical protein
MTAEIAIMNSQAIALAADSAVTVGAEGESKVYNTANKLFMLSKYEPVGVMIFGDATFMGIPWEVIIKSYRDLLKKTRFNTIEEYANDFIERLEKNSWFFAETPQIDFIQETAACYFMNINADIDEKVKQLLDDSIQLDADGVKRLINRIIEFNYNEVREKPLLQNFDSSDVQEIVTKYGKEIEEVVAAVFQKLPLSKASVKMLKEIAGFLVCNTMFHSATSGIVIAGFGERDFFPKLVSYDIMGAIKNRLKYRQIHSSAISFERRAAVIPFAQIEMVSTFMDGVDPFYSRAIDGWLSGILDFLPEAIVGSLDKLSEKEKEKLTKKAKSVSRAILDDAQKSLSELQKLYSNPVTSAVALLPKEELALMAESLVNLTSLKRRVSMEAETVGGAVDVAVISKGDGFIWMKRKHYFEPKYNNHFFCNYYRE